MSKVLKLNAIRLDKQKLMPMADKNFTCDAKTQHRYEQRRNNMPEYKELFQALLKFSDTQFRDKILNYINATYCDAATQTDSIEVQSTQLGKRDQNAEVLSIGSPFSTADVKDKAPETSNMETSAEDSQVLKKRKRKRKVSLPQANKESRVAVTQKLQKVKLNSKNHSPLPRKADSNSKHDYEKAPKRRRSDSCDSSILDIANDICTSQCQQMAAQLFFKEYLLRHVQQENGLLPIQNAVIKNQTITLKKHIFFWKNSDLNEILTDDGEDLLQLAIVCSCQSEIIDLLIKSGLNTDSVDERGNTVLHLAVLHDVHSDSMRIIMQSINLKKVLVNNDDGYNPLHLAIRQDQYLLAECMLNTIDERLFGKQLFTRDYNKLETDENITRKDFYKFYEDFCMKITDSDITILDHNNYAQKQEILQSMDMRGGNTSLFFAIENQSEHLIYFLLAHLTDPRTENLCGQDCKAFFADFGKALNLSLNIDNTMENVIYLITHKQNSRSS